MTSPEALFHRLLAGIAEGRWNDLAELYAEDARVELPFAPPAALVLNGRDAIAAHFSLAAKAPFSITPANVRVHGTDDPELIVVEFDYHLRHNGTGRTGTVANVQLLRVRDGKIVESRDFHDHRAIAELAAG